MTQSNFNSKRIESIDVFRALTMFLMIFVNDFWTLTNVPEGLQHMDAQVDAIGFSDIIFPAFLFIVGLSIPFAIKARRNKGDSNGPILVHVFKRTLALIIMGLFMVNFESINADLLLINKYAWELIMGLAIFLIWTLYKPAKKNQKKTILQLTGLALLIFLAVIYKGGSNDNVLWMQTHWWGILGLIGWAYLLNTLIYLFFGRSLVILWIVFIVFHVLNIEEFASVTGIPNLKFVISASMHVAVCAGMIVGSVMLHFKALEKEKLFLLFVLVLGIVSLVYGFALRPYWGGFSKVRGTPSWASVCIGISCLSFLVLYVIVDKLKFKTWTNLFKIAGTNTLTCYLIPYFIYPLVMIFALSLPDILLDGYIGLLKSLVFSFIVIGITALLNNINIKLKV
ncbi:DUF5009 domain-containing protein [Tamlana sp. 2201CG12-4]|uniref:heparan-alpha-glucosaminide N-acetyltransferase domain-containing protein n=1 Tax=Tamlana sp. 2201CG12-4 TaxID=3112582 RepID=UPI002DBA981D|nr:DUF5009 domain-containing protein [Tamlana sp. 2201CG12-4]MEC3906185.1 DUF5009 domain-containing protein [Tamlana sp. 2201CG12-4]